MVRHHFRHPVCLLVDQLAVDPQPVQPPANRCTMVAFHIGIVSHDSGGGHFLMSVMMEEVIEPTRQAF